MVEGKANTLRLLVVEDSEDLVSVWKILFREAGYHARFCMNGKSAISLVDQGYVPDILITDYYLPDLTGQQVIEQVRARNSAVRFLMITGNSDVGFVRALKEQGIEVLCKPVKFAQLEATLAAVAG